MMLSANRDSWWFLLHVLCGKTEGGRGIYPSTKGEVSEIQVSTPQNRRLRFSDGKPNNLTVFGITKGLEYQVKEE